MATYKGSKGVREWVESEAKRNMNLIAISSIDKLERQLKTSSKNGGFTQADTGNMIRSIRKSVTSMPQVDTGEKEYTDVQFFLSPDKLGGHVYIGVQAVYGPRMNYGFTGEDSLGRNYNYTGSFFVEKAGAMWDKFKAESAKEIGSAK